jgi:hypothetical protein
VWTTDQIDLWRKWIEDFVINDVRKALEGDTLEVGLIILSLLGTECLSGYYCGKKANRLTFVEFVNKYFPPLYHPYAEFIYLSLRDGLVHDYIIKKIMIASTEQIPFVMNRDKSEPHLSPLSPTRPFPIWFNRATFANDFLAAWGMYSVDIKNDPELLKNVIARAKTSSFLIVGPVDESGFAIP